MTTADLIRDEIMRHRIEAIENPSLLQISQDHIDALYKIKDAITPDAIASHFGRPVRKMAEDG